MSSKLFNASMFKPTEFSSAEDKAKFANHLIRFIESDYNPNLFYKWFYTRLSMTFGHIANYNGHGFYSYWFYCDKAKKSFLDKLLNHIPNGQAEYTFSDVESAIQSHLRKG